MAPWIGSRCLGANSIGVGSRQPLPRWPCLVPPAPVVAPRCNHVDATEPFREFDRITDELLSEGRVGQAPVDAYRRGHDFKVEIDLPGADPDSIDLTVEKDVLTVRRRARRRGQRVTRSRWRSGPRPVQPPAVPGREPGPRSRQRHLPRRRAHHHHPRGEASQAPQGRDHSRRKRGPGRTGGLGHRLSIRVSTRRRSEPLSSGLASVQERAAANQAAAADRPSTLPPSEPGGVGLRGDGFETGATHRR
jgi:hypothetical protein